jgi:hypothetical protein
VVLNQDLAAVAYRVAFFSAPTGITVLPGNFPNVSQDGPGFFMPARPLAETLDIFAGLVTPDGAQWFVTADRELHFVKIV